MNVHISPVIAAVEKHVVDIFRTKLDARYVFHNMQHTFSVRDAGRQLADKSGLTNHEPRTRSAGACDVVARRGLHRDV